MKVIHDEILPVVFLLAVLFRSTLAAGDDRCLNAFDVNIGTIIKPTDSIGYGAKYLGSKENAANNQDCQSECCRIPGCNTAIYHAVDRDCYFFNCGELNEGYRCVFGRHDNYSTVAMKMTRAEFDETNVNEPKKSQSALNKNLITKSRNPSSDWQWQSSSENCNRWQWQCQTMAECIAKFDVCDGIPQCVDKSDEDVEMCKVYRQKFDLISTTSANYDYYDLQYPHAPEIHNAAVPILPNAVVASPTSEGISDDFADDLANSNTDQSGKSGREIWQQRGIDDHSRSAAMPVIGLTLACLLVICLIYSLRLMLSERRNKRHDQWQPQSIVTDPGKCQKMLDSGIYH